MYSLMSIWMSASCLPNICAASCFAVSVLPTPVGPTKRKEPIGLRGSLRSARERRSARAIDAGGDALAHDGLLDLGLEVEELLALLLLHARERDPGPVGDHLYHEVLVDGDPLLLAGLLPLLGRLLLLRAQLLLAVAELGGLLEMLLADRLLLLRAHLLDLLGQALDVRRPVERRDARARARLVHDVDRLVGQEAPGDVAVGELRGRLERDVGEGHLVVVLVLPADPLQDRDRVVDGGRLHLDRLEAAVEGAVLLDVLAVLVERRRARRTGARRGRAPA